MINLNFEWLFDIYDIIRNIVEPIINAIRVIFESLMRVFENINFDIENKKVYEVSNIEYYYDSNDPIKKESSKSYIIEILKKFVDWTIRICGVCKSVSYIIENYPQIKHHSNIVFDFIKDTIIKFFDF